MPEGIQEARRWWFERAKEPSTYQGLSMLAGVIGAFFFGDSMVGIHALEIGMAVAGVIGVGKAEAVEGRDY